jgi:hypothetical protein
MFEKFNAEARQVVVNAQDEAKRLSHGRAGRILVELAKMIGSLPALIRICPLRGYLLACGVAIVAAGCGGVSSAHRISTSQTNPKYPPAITGRFLRTLFIERDPRIAARLLGKQAQMTPGDLRQAWDIWRSVPRYKVVRRLVADPRCPQSRRGPQPCFSAHLYSREIDRVDNVVLDTLTTVWVWIIREEGRWRIYYVNASSAGEDVCTIAELRHETRTKGDQGLCRTTVPYPG